MARTSLRFSPVRGRLPVLILLAVAVVAMIYQWYIGFLSFQYIHGLSDVQIAVAMIPTQILAITAARIAPRVIIARGLRTTAVAGTLLTSMACLLFLLVQAGQSVIVLVCVMAIYGCVSTASSVAISNATMNAVPKQHSGAMSSFRSASGTLGGAISTVIMGTLIFGVYNHSLESSSAAAGIDAPTSSAAAQALNAGVNEVDVSSQMAIPQTEVSTIETLNLDAMVDAMHAKSIAAAALGLVGAGMLSIAIRRRTDDEDAQPETAAKPA